MKRSLRFLPPIISRLSLVATTVFLCGCAASSNTGGVIFNGALLNRAYSVNIGYQGNGKPSVRYLAKKGVYKVAKPKPACKLPVKFGRLQPLHNGAWVWDTKMAEANPGRLFRKLFLYHVSTVFLQIPLDLGGVARLVGYLERRGIKVVALTGDPHDISEPLRVATDVKKVEQYNEVHRYKFTGLQLDVEPYTLADFSLNKSADLKKYFLMLAHAKRAMRPGMQLSAVVPFWYAVTRVDGASVVKEVLKICNFVVVMSYRTRLPQIKNISSETLCYGAKMQKKVFIGLEDAPLPTEVHYVVPVRILRPFLKEIKGGRLVLSGPPLEIIAARRYETKGSKLSFYGESKALIRVMQQRPSAPSFAGWVIDGFSFAPTNAQWAGAN